MSSVFGQGCVPRWSAINPNIHTLIPCSHQPTRNMGSQQSIIVILDGGGRSDLFVPAARQLDDSYGGPMNLHQRFYSQTPIIALQNFILSTRDSGYKSTASAISELVDNAIQAKACHIDISIKSNSDVDRSDLSIAVADDGLGMGRSVLMEALRFGGSSRFNNRSGLGRFGMGLPNASLGQAARVVVYTQEPGGRPLSTYLDVDEIGMPGCQLRGRT